MLLGTRVLHSEVFGDSIADSDKMLEKVSMIELFDGNIDDGSELKVSLERRIVAKVSTSVMEEERASWKLVTAELVTSLDNLLKVDPVPIS